MCGARRRRQVGAEDTDDTRLVSWSSGKDSVCALQLARASVDIEVAPLGERGECQTFVWDGPGFREPVPVEVGDVVERDGFVFCDLLPST